MLIVCFSVFSVPGETEEVCAVAVLNLGQSDCYMSTKILL